MKNENAPSPIPKDLTRQRSTLGLLGSAAAVIVSLACATNALAQAVITDNFDSGTLSSAWQVRNVVQPLGGYVNNSFPANGAGKALRLQRGSGDMSLLGYPQVYGTGRAWLFRTENYTDFYVAQDIVNWNAETNQAIVLLARASGYDDQLVPGVTPPGLGTVNGYVCNYDNLQDGDGPGDRYGGQFQINRVDGESPRTIAAAEVTLTPGKTYRQVFQAVGPNFTARLYDSEDLTTPIVTLVATDEVYPSGVCGIVSFHRNDNVHPNRTDMTVDNYYSGPTDPDADIAPAIRHVAAGTPQVVTRNPAQRFKNFHPAATGISFTARTFSANQINASATKLYLNGVDVSASLAPLPPNGSTAAFATAPGTLLPNTVYAARIELTDSTGTLKSTNTFWFDTFTDAYLASTAVKVIEAEEYNYSNGMYLLDPVPVSGVDTNGNPVYPPVGGWYYGVVGTPGVDYNDKRTSVDNGWNDFRPEDFASTPQGNREDLSDGAHPPPTTPPSADPTRLNDSTRKKYADLGMKEYQVSRTEPTEWMNYTRSFTETNYYVYLRVGSYGAQKVKLDLVGGDPTTTAQTTTPLGVFSVPNQIMRPNYLYQPLMAGSVPAVIRLGGTQTIRLTIDGIPVKQNFQVVLNYLLFIPTSNSPTVFDDFNDGDDASWLRYDPIQTGSYTFPGGNSYRLQTAASPDPATYGQGRVGALAPGEFTKFYVAADVVAWDDSLKQVFGLLARATNPGPGTTSGYGFTKDRGNPDSTASGDMDIFRLDGEAVTVLANLTGSDAVYFQPGEKYRLVFMGNGNQFRGQVFQLPDLATPIVDITAEDEVSSTYPSGMSGLLVANNAGPLYDGPGDATFDNFLATTGEPRLTPSIVGGNLRLTWPDIPFTLQTSPSLTSPAWTPVTSGITKVGDENVYTTAAISGAYYRLVFP